MSILQPKYGNFIFTVLCFWLMASGIFLIFGPPEAVYSLGVLYFFLGAMGFFGSTTGNATLMNLFVLYGMILWFIAIGAAKSFVGNNSRAEGIDTNGCNTAFAGNNLDRCKDDGFLNYDRFVLILNQFVLSAAFVVALVSYAAPDLVGGSGASQSSEPAQPAQAVPVSEPTPSGEHTING